ncbi:hypothetical protein [Caulobacter sp. CCH5-E12]|nr:hypothetical protein [Caulobacter sp. CCH5-E12]
MSNQQDSTFFRPASRSDFGQRSKIVAKLTGLKVGEAQQWLCRLYGYSDLRALQREVDSVEAGTVDIPEGPYRQLLPEDSLSEHVRDHVCRLKAAVPGVDHGSADKLVALSLYDRAEALRHSLAVALGVPERGRADPANKTPNAPKRHRPKNVFYSTVIGGRRYFGVIYGSDVMVCTQEGVSSYISPSMLSYLHAADNEPRRVSSNVRADGWYVCKWDRNQPRFLLEGFSEADAQIFSDEFGIPIFGRFSLVRPFRSSPAGHGLARWVKEQPDRARTLGSQSEYLPDWD